MLTIISKDYGVFYIFATYINVFFVVALAEVVGLRIPSIESRRMESSTYRSEASSRTAHSELNLYWDWRFLYGDANIPVPDKIDTCKALGWSTTLG